MAGYHALAKQAAVPAWQHCPERAVAETLSRPVSDADRRVILGIPHERV